MKARIGILLAVLLAFVCSPLASLAQTGTTGALTGTIHSSSGAPVAGAQILVRGQVNRETTSDAQGAFAFANLPAGFYRLDVNKGGYVTATLDNIAILMGETEPVTVTLEQADLTSLKTIARVSTSAHSSINTGAAQTAFVGRNQIVDLANPQINDVVQRIPGAGIERGSASPNTSISLGGAQSYETQVLLDGHPLSAGRYGVWFSQFFSSFMLQGIEAQSGPGNTTPFAGTAVGGTANLVTPGFTSKPTYEFIAGSDWFGAQYSNALVTGKAGKVSYVADASYQALNGQYFGNRGCMVKTSNYAALNTPSATGIVQDCINVSGPLTTKGEVLKARYDFSPSTSLEAGFVGSQAGYNPQGIAYAQYGGLVTVLNCYGAAGKQQCTDPRYANLIGQKIPAYIFYPGSIVTNNQPIFEGQLRTAVGNNNTLLVRPYAGNITRSINGSGEAAYADHWYPVSEAANCPAAQQGPVVNGYKECYNSPFSLLESDKLHGTTVSLIHPFGSNSVTATYDTHSDETFAYYGNPSSVNTPDTLSKFNTLSLTGDLALSNELTMKAGLYGTNWKLDGKTAGTPVTDPVSHKTTVPLVGFTRSNSRFDPHIAFVLQPSSGMSYRLAVGSSASYPYASQVSGNPFITPGSATAPNGTLNQKNPDLNPEVATSANLGLDKRFRNGGIFSLDYTAMNIKNVFETVVTPASGPIDPVKGTPSYSAILQPVNVAKLRSKMLAFNYRYEPLRGLGYGVNGTFTSSIVDGVPSSFYTSPTAYVQPANGQQQCSNGGSQLCLPYFKAYGHLQFIDARDNYFALNADFQGKNNTYNQPPFVIYDATVRHPINRVLDLQGSIQNILNTNTFSGLPEFNLGVPQIGQSSTGLGQIVVPRIPVAPRNVRLQLHWHLNR